MIPIKKRILAYLIDLIIIFTFILILHFIYPVKTEVITIESKLLLLSSYTNNDISFSTYFQTYATLTQQLNQAKIIYIISDSLILLWYFVAIPFLMNGQTFGKKIMKIKIVTNQKQRASFKALLIRGLYTGAIYYTILSLMALYLMSANMYMETSIFLGFVYFILVIISTFMIIYRSDKKGLEDIISNTCVINSEV